MQRNNPVLIIAGPSAVGKTVVAKAIVEKDPRFTFLRSATTRPRRGDVHDDEYLYYTEQEFVAAVERGEFVEHMNYGGCMYGTTKAEMNAALGRGQIPLLVLDLCGVESLYRAEEYSACSVYIYADVATIESRLYARSVGCEGDTEGLLTYEKRRKRNLQDLISLPTYSPYIHSFVRNADTIEDCRDRVMAIFESFCDGAVTDSAGNSDVAASLAASAQGSGC